jgi:hypothetical protein
MFAGVSPDNKSNVSLDSSTVGMLAEYHIEKGISDLDLVAALRKVGYEIVLHDRYAGGRTNWVRNSIKFVGDATTFKLILRKPLLS